MIVIDGAAGHAFGDKEVTKMNNAQVDDQTVMRLTEKGGTEYFTTQVPNSDGIEERQFEIISRKDQRNGFRAIAYVEVDDKGKRISDPETGKPELRLSFQGWGGLKDTLTSLKIIARADATHEKDVEAFVNEAVENMEEKGGIGSVIIGSHSQGAMNAMKAMDVVDGIEAANVKDIVLLETFGAKIALQHLSEHVADATGQSVKAVYEDFAKRITSVNSDPPSIVGKMEATSEPLGNVFTINMDALSEILGQDLSALDRHRLGQMARAI